MRNSLNMRRYVILIYLLCTACGTALPSVKPFKLDVQQGNVVTSKMLLQLRPGMTKSQVRFIMGSPLIQDSFHGNRWDYAYQLRENGKLKEQRRVILDFENDVLKTVRGDVVPAGSEAAKALQAEADATAAVVKKQEEKSMVDKLKFWDKNNEATPSNLAPASAVEPKMAKGAILNSQVAAPEALLANQADVNVENQQLPADTIEATATASKGLSETRASADAVSANEVQVNDAPSILAVPLVDMPESQSVPSVESVTPAESLASEAAPTSLPIVSAPAIEDVAPAAALVPATVAPVAEASNTASEPAQEDLPLSDTTYQSEAGMLFDRSLKMTPQDPAEIAARFAVDEVDTAVNADSGIPAPKPLPAESEPGFFDRMLERIGF